MDAGAAKIRYARCGGAFQRTYAVLLINTLAGTRNQAHVNHPFVSDLRPSGPVMEIAWPELLDFITGEGGFEGIHIIEQNDNFVQFRGEENNPLPGFALFGPLLRGFRRTGPAMLF